jgi:hypothetical protein
VSSVSLAAAAFAVMLAGCAQRNVAAKEAAGKWWNEFTTAAKPEPAGTVTPANTTVSKTGKTYTVPSHVQTADEAAQEAGDADFTAHKRASVKGFTVKGQTITVSTGLGDLDISEARDLCRDLGAFVWAKENRHFGIENIVITGLNGDVLSSREGLGAVR